MLKGAALFYTIIVSLVIALVTGAFILSIYFTKLDCLRPVKFENATLNCFSALNLELNRVKKIESYSYRKIDLYGSSKDSVQISSYPWGVYSIINSSASTENTPLTKSALTGTFTKNNIALFLCDNEKPLSIVGKTQITGDCYLPKSGVKPAYIEGQSYSGGKLINGKVSNSKNTLPSSTFDISKWLLTLSSGHVQNTITLSHSPIDTIISFREPTRIYQVKNALVLNQSNLQGNIIVISSKSITVSSSSNLSDIILYAPQIIIEDNTKGNFQAFANDSLVIGKNCVLNYPSAVGLLSGDSKNEGKLFIGEGTRLSGLVFSESKGSFPTKISLGNKSEITGNVFSQGPLELKGSVLGSIYTQSFYLTTPSSYYENHLLNATINVSLLSSFFVNSNCFGEGSNKIIKWVN